MATKKTPTNPTPHSQAETFRKTRVDHSKEIAEDYVEAIAQLQSQEGLCRVTRLARELGVSHVTANRTVENIEGLFLAADRSAMPIFISPHYYYEHDHRWKFEGTLEALMHGIGMFDRPHALTLEGFEGSGADWLERYKPVIENGRTVVTSPHKVYGPDSNDLVLQLRKAGISKVILGGMSSNLCTESHMRALVEAGFEVMVVTDATAGAITEHYDGYAASLVNFRMIASAVDNPANTLRAIAAAYE